jgi:hypothetical protein
MKHEGINAPALALAILLAIGATITALALRSVGQLFSALASCSRFADLACSW